MRDMGDNARETWPSLPLDGWQDTKETLHAWSQIVGKVRLSLTPLVNHWWNVPLYVTPRGLTTSAMPYGAGSVEARFDFLDHGLWIETTSGQQHRIALEPRSVADFYREVMDTLRGFGIGVKFWEQPSEVENPIPFGKDDVHRSYDAEAAERFGRVLLEVDRVLHLFRKGFVGKCSPVHFWWGGFDMSCTRFSGQRAPLHPGGIPHLPAFVAREGYSHECSSAGWWPGGGGFEAAFYSYTYPEPAGFVEAAVAPAGAYYDPNLKEFILPYEVVRTAANPDEALLAFLQSTYEAGAELGGWDRASLERPRDYDPRVAFKTP
jgi:hypothetical protein